MKYAPTVTRVGRLAVRNPFAIMLISVTSSLSFLPFFCGILLAGEFGGMVGLWTTSMLLGFVAVGGAHMSNMVLEREVSLGTSYYWEGIRAGKRLAPVVGIGTFLVGFLVLVLFGNPIRGFAALSLSMLGVYLLLGWGLLTIFALTVWATADGTVSAKTAFRRGARLLLDRPLAAVWILVQAIGWTLLSIPLIIAPVLLLPGFVQMIGTAIVRRTIDIKQN